MLNDLHNSERKHTNALANMERNRGLSARNRQLIRQFAEDPKLSNARKAKIIHTLVRFAQWSKKDLDKLDNDNARRVFDGLSNGVIKTVKNTDGKGRGGAIRPGQPYGKATINDTIAIMRKFYVKFLEKPEVMKGVNSSHYEKEIDASTIWTDEEMGKLVDATTDVQRKAFVAVLTESGCRISEVANLRIRDVERNGEDIVFRIINGKNKWSRRPVVLIDSTAYLTNWLDTHPQKNNPDAPLWVNSRGTSMGYTTLKNFIAKAVKLTGVKKPYNCHQFRHSAITRDYRRGMRPIELGRSKGWSPSSRMLTRYTHLSEGDVMAELKRIRGLVPTEAQTDTATNCPKCKSFYRNLDLAVHPHCQKCGYTLDATLRIKEENKRTDELASMKSQLDKLTEFMTLMAGGKDKTLYLKATTGRLPTDEENNLIQEAVRHKLGK